MTETDRVMKKCQTGTKDYNEANNLHAECYGEIGRLKKSLEEIRGMCGVNNWGEIIRHVDKTLF